MNFADLHQHARAVLNPRRLSASAAAMVTAGEHRVVRMIAVNWDGRVLPPCGRCREFISQLHDDNLDAEVRVADDTVVRLRELLPHDWRAVAEG